MQIIFRKISPLKKRRVMSVMKKAFAAVVAGYAFRYGRIDLNADLWANSDQHLETTYSYQEFTDGNQSVNSIRIKTGSGTILTTRKEQNQTSEALKVRSGDLGKSGPGSKAKADSRRNFKAGKFSSGSTIIQGANGFVPQQTYCHYHKSDPPLSCKTSVKVSDSPFQGDGDNNQPPPEGTNFDASQYKDGPNPFLDKFDYDNPNHTRENTDFSSQKRMNHAYDRHAEKCFGMKENRNKESLKKFEGNARGFIESPETEKINGSYRYETPAYFYKEKDGNLVTIVNATDNSFITVVNATESQLNSIGDNKNFGLDTRPSMELTLRLRGPKNQN
jgi:hypothetical protein